MWFLLSTPSPVGDRALAISGPSDITSLPDFNTTFLTLLLISHVGYLGGKVPDRGENSEQDVPTNSVATVTAQRVADQEAGQPTDPAEAARKLRDEARTEYLKTAKLTSTSANDGNPAR